MSDRVRMFILCAPVRYATAAQLRERADVKRRILAAGGCPVFLPDSLTGFLDDEDPGQRAIALACSESFVRSMARSHVTTEMVIVGNQVSAGMKLDIEAWLDETEKHAGERREPITPVRAIRMLTRVPDEEG